MSILRTKRSPLNFAMEKRRKRRSVHAIRQEIEKIKSESANIDNSGTSFEDWKEKSIQSLKESAQNVPLTENQPQDPVPATEEGHRHRRRRRRSSSKTQQPQQVSPEQQMIFNEVHILVDMYRKRKEKLERESQNKKETEGQ